MTRNDINNSFLFLYLIWWIKLTIYIDLVILINFIFDFVLILITDLLLKRNITIKKVLYGSLIGELSLIVLFLNLNKLSMFLLKLILSILMIVVTFGFKSFKYTITNLIYLFLNGIILGGFIYYMSYLFLDNIGLSIKYVGILILSLLFMIIYYSFYKNIKTNYNNKYEVIIKYSHNKFIGVGYLDSANKLTSPYSGKPIILVEKRYINLNKLKLLPVIYNTLNHTGVINCFKPDEVIVNGKKYNVLIGLSDTSFNLECEVLLNNRMGIIWYLKR